MKQNIYNFRMSNNSQTYDCTILNYGDKLIGIPLRDVELSKYVSDMDRYTLTNGLFCGIL